MTSLKGDFWSPEVTWGHSCHVTASPCELQPCRKWNVRYTLIFGLLQPLPCDFRENDLSSGPLPGTRGQVMSFSVMRLPLPASYSLVGSEMYSIHQFSTFHSHCRVTSGEMTSLPSQLRSSEVTWRHFLFRECLLLELQPCRKWNVQYTQVFVLLEPLPCDFRSNDVTSGSPTVHEVTWRHFPSRDCLPLEMQRCRKWNVQYTRVFGLLQPIPGEFRSNDVTSGSLMVTSGHVTSILVT